MSCCVVLQLALVAQAPNLAKLGPLPLDLPVVDLPLAAAQPLPAGGAIVLRVGKDTPWGQVQAALDRFAAGGGTLVHFAAVLPDGSPGALTVALPESAEAPTVLNLRAHAGRPGTPPESGIPLLQRAVEGWRARSKEPFVLGIEVPADATQEQALRLLAAGVEGGAERVVLRVGQATKVPKARLAAGLALDFVGPIGFQVPGAMPAAKPVAKPAGKPGGKPAGKATEPALPVSTQTGSAYGALLAAPGPKPVAPMFPEGGGGIGGRYRRTDAATQATLRTIRDAAQFGIASLVAKANPDGSCGTSPRLLEATALLALTLLVDGHAVDLGPEKVRLGAALGWLFVQQKSDGDFGATGPGSTRVHAAITRAFAMAQGASDRGAILAKATELAAQHLTRLRRLDGGWNDGTPDAPSDPVSTAIALEAITALQVLGGDPPQFGSALPGWLDSLPLRGGIEAAAELWARQLLGQDPARTPRMTTLTQFLESPLDDPQYCYFWSSALNQEGSRHWPTYRGMVERKIPAWQQQLGAALGAKSSGGAADPVIACGWWTLALQAVQRRSSR
ncbi:MAG: hypothetical protein JNL12_11295 [Planctomycetes bacterium]|nr:hypothetical protein [Planctomycetota bacterium]